MNNIIEQMYNGDLFPSGKLEYSGEDYCKAMDELVSIEDTLLKTYPQIYDSFRKYQDAQIQIMSLSNGQEFVRGFRVGAQIALEMVRPIE